MTSRLISLQSSPEHCTCTSVSSVTWDCFFPVTWGFSTILGFLIMPWDFMKIKSGYNGGHYLLISFESNYQDSQTHTHTLTYRTELPSGTKVVVGRIRYDLPKLSTLVNFTSVTCSSCLSLTAHHGLVSLSVMTHATPECRPSFPSPGPCSKPSPL